MKKRKLKERIGRLKAERDELRRAVVDAERDRARVEREVGACAQRVQRLLDVSEPPPGAGSGLWGFTASAFWVGEPSLEDGTMPVYPAGVLLNGSVTAPALDGFSHEPLRELELYTRGELKTQGTYGGHVPTQWSRLPDKDQCLHGRPLPVRSFPVGTFERLSRVAESLRLLLASLK